MNSQKVSTNEVMTRALLVSALEDNYRWPRNGEFCAEITTGKPFAETSEDTSWDVYRGAYKGWKCVLKYPTVRVRASWLRRVAEQGLAVLDGMITLDARRLPARKDAPNGAEVYKAVWVKQGRGLSIAAEHGYIAVCRGYAYHSTETPAAAVAGLRKKMTCLDVDADTRSAADLYRRAAQVPGDTPVSVSDAKAVGSCQSGIESWCERVGIDAKAGSVPLRRFLRALSVSPRREALATLAHVVRRESRRVGAAA